MAFRGGYTFKNFEGKAEPSLHELPVPERIFIPFDMGNGISFSPLIKAGDTVSAGGKLLESREDAGCTVVSPVSGKVKTVGDQGITIESDGSNYYEPVGGHPRAPWELEHRELFHLMCSTGSLLFFDGHCKSAEDCKQVKHVIISALHNGPLNHAWKPEIFGSDNLFPDGIRTLKTLFPEAEIVIAINKRTKNYFTRQEITELADVRVLSDKYPQEIPGLLARDTVDFKLVSPDGTYNRSILVVPFVNVIQTAEVMTQGRPLIDRILMVAGPGVSRPGWYRIRLGTTFEEIERRLLKSDGEERWRIVRGDLFTGMEVSEKESSISLTDTEISVIREHDIRELWRFMWPGFRHDSYPKIMMSNVIPLLPKFLDSNVHGGTRPCVQCNYCDEVCPAGIYPHLIWKFAVSEENIEDSFRFRPYDCVECGLCDYVCPSKISISEAVVKAKNEYRNSRRPDESAD